MAVVRVKGITAIKSAGGNASLNIAELLKPQQQQTGFFDSMFSNPKIQEFIFKLAADHLIGGKAGQKQPKNFDEAIRMVEGQKGIF